MKDATRAAGRTGLTVFVLATVAACSAAAGTSPISGATASAPAAGPLAVIGDWQSIGSNSVPQGVRLRFADDQVRVSLPCGVVAGHWDAAASGEIVVRIDSYGEECSRTGTTQPSWVSTVRHFLVHTGQLVLTGPDGRTIGVFNRRPWTGAGLGSPLGAGPLPTVDTFSRQYLDPAPLPSGAEPVTAVSLVGTWLPTTDQDAGAKNVLRILSAGKWTGWTGCRLVSGDWALGAGGQLLQTSFAVPLDRCVPPATTFLTGAARAGNDHGELILTDSGGAVVGRFTRELTVSPQPRTSST